LDHYSHPVEANLLANPIDLPMMASFSLRLTFVGYSGVIMNTSKLFALILLGCVSGPLLAADMSPMQHEYMTSMGHMQGSMQSSMMETNPDIAFAKGMLAHHQGAVEMARIQLKYGKDPEMRTLAENVIKSQGPEIQQMQAWLAAHPE
jgi:hypothetical protein